MVPTECWVQASPQTVPVKADLGAGVTVDHLRGRGSPQPLGHILLPAHVLALSLALRSTGVRACAAPAQGWAGSGLWMEALLGTGHREGIPARCGLACMGTGALGDLRAEKDPRNEFLCSWRSHSMADGHVLMVVLEIGGPPFTACCPRGLAEGRCSQAWPGGGRASRASPLLCVTAPSHARERLAPGWKLQLLS